MKVLYRAAPAWEVGANTHERIPGSHYPDDYAGKVIAVKPLDHPFTPADLSGGRALVELDLTDEQRTGLADRRLKVGADCIVQVTFDDRWGHLATGLRDRWGSGVIDKEAESIALAEPVVDRPAQPVESAFDLEVARLTADLPAMVVHSGAGLYEVGPGKTYSTIQAAVDQLWTDQGAAVFTASQYIRIFADTYDENVVPNTGFRTNEAYGYTLVIEGDPAEGRDNIIVQPTGGTYVLHLGTALEHCLVRHLTLDAMAGASTFARPFGCRWPNARLGGPGPGASRLAR